MFESKESEAFYFSFLALIFAVISAFGTRIFPQDGDSTESSMYENFPLVPANGMDRMSFMIFILAFLGWIIHTKAVHHVVSTAHKHAKAEGKDASRWKYPASSVLIMQIRSLVAVITWGMIIVNFSRYASATTKQIQVDKTAVRERAAPCLPSQICCREGRHHMCVLAQDWDTIVAALAAADDDASAHLVRASEPASHHRVPPACLPACPAPPHHGGERADCCCHILHVGARVPQAKLLRGGARWISVITGWPSDLDHRQLCHIFGVLLHASAYFATLPDLSPNAEGWFARCWIYANRS